MDDVTLLIEIAKLHGALDAMLQLDILDDQMVMWISQRSLLLVKECDKYLTTSEELGDKGGEEGERAPSDSESLSEKAAKQPYIPGLFIYEEN